MEGGPMAASQPGRGGAARGLGHCRPGSWANVGTGAPMEMAVGEWQETAGAELQWTLSRPHRRGRGEDGQREG
jgi:hypothetical protein